MPSETGGMRNRSGGMSVSLASPDGRVVGGGVAGLLVAASPVQVSFPLCSVCSFTKESHCAYCGNNLIYPSKTNCVVRPIAACYLLFFLGYPSNTKCVT